MAVYLYLIICISVICMAWMNIKLWRIFFSFFMAALLAIFTVFHLTCILFVASI